MKIDLMPKAKLVETCQEQRVRIEGYLNKINNLETTINDQLKLIKELDSEIKPLRHDVIYWKNQCDKRDDQIKGLLQAIKAIMGVI